MKTIKKYLNVIVGCLIIAIAIDFIIIPNNLLTFGISGIATLIYYLNGVNVGINLLIMNIIGISISSFFVNKERIKEYILPSFLIPILIYVLSFFTNSFILELPEMLIVIIVAAFLISFGYSLIYKQGYSTSVVFLLEDVIGKITKFHSKIYSWLFDCIILTASLVLFGYYVTLYSLIVIVISKYMITKTRFGINDSKVFYIITSKEKEVKHFILHDLKYELTVLDVKGGFSKKKNEILLSVIDSKDYYKFKEGIKIIDPDAFIAICDTYDVVNKKSF
ncbi:MAG: YitT family protein [Erysipelotrichales bacterium]|nr:YitT family protein [Erysipelotrichales bacterium]